MKTSETQEAVAAHLQKLEEKYSSLGQDMLSYLEGLLYSNVLTYWDYIHLDTLLTLQKPKTDFPDENIFIIYHQITELYLKMIRQEIDQMTAQQPVDPAFLLARIRRVIRYFENLVQSFDVMVDGMEQGQFLKFRMSLLPASGFQSAQFRFVEICSTDFRNLLAADAPTGEAYDQLADYLYWTHGASELSSGKKTLTAHKFEEKYRPDFIALGESHRQTNLLQLFRQVSPQALEYGELKEAFRYYDALVNVHWKLVHYKSAVRYLTQDPEVIAATGGTNWQKYLPPRFQKRQFFPELWSETEKEEWGRKWVDELAKPRTRYLYQY